MGTKPAQVERVSFDDEDDDEMKYWISRLQDPAVSTFLVVVAFCNIILYLSSPICLGLAVVSVRSDPHCSVGKFIWLT